MEINYVIIFVLKMGILTISLFSDTTRVISRTINVCEFEPRCVCYDVDISYHTENANCSHRKFSSIPTLNFTVVRLDLSNNKISEINEGTFQNSSSMVELDCSYNIIYTIQSGSFKGLTKLRNLNLKGNKLIYRENVFDKHCFKPLKNLKILNIEDNIGFYTAGQIYPTLSDLGSLENLTMDGVQDQDLALKMENLTNLRSLKISNFSGICVMKSLHVNSFENTPSLTNVEILGCKLKSIQRGTFNKLTSLNYLDMSYNTNLNFDGVFDLIYDLQFTAIKILKLNKIHSTFHINVRVPYNLTKHLRNTSLVELHLDSNRIQLADTGVIPNVPPTLSFLSAADNDFTYGAYLYETLFMNITTLNISNLFATHDIPTGRINKRSESTKRESIKKWNSWLYSMIKEDKQNTYFDKKAILKSIWKGLEVNPHVPVPKNLKNAYVNRCLIRFVIPQCTFLDNSIEYFDGSDNLVTNWIGPIFNLPNLKYVDISSNFCSNISSYFFQNITTIETLLINNNLLGFIIPSDTDGTILFPLRNLKVLDISQNRIHSVPKDFFRSQFFLEKLNLSSNMLVDISFDLSGMSNLRMIDLSNNRIASLGTSILESLDDKTHSRNVTLDLSNNPLQCNCETIKFVKWFITTKVTLRNIKYYECTHRDKSKSFLKDSKEIYGKLSKQCSNYRNLTWAISTAIIFFITILVIGILYRYRWKIRYLYYMTKQKYNDYNLVSHDFIYDAFISYADEDQDFVHGEMIANLEEKFSLKLCLHKRDFVPGRDIAANITNAIHNSKNTIVVMSQHFLKSYWCMFEFNMARMESIYSREKEQVLLLILYEHVPVNDLPLVLLELIHSESFIEFPHDEVGNDVFWMKMKEALQ